MNLVTKENLFITGFILVIVLGICYLMYLELKKYINKEIMKILNNVNSNLNKKKQDIQQIQQIQQNKQQLQQKQQNIQQLQPNMKINGDDENKDIYDDGTDLDSNIDSYVNPLPSVNDNNDDDDDDDNDD